MGWFQDTSIIANLIRTVYKSEDERAAEVVNLLLAGHDTTGYTLAWALVELARHPAALARLQVEYV